MNVHVCVHEVRVHVCVHICVFGMCICVRMDVRVRSCEAILTYVLVGMHLFTRRRQVIIKIDITTPPMMELIQRACLWVAV